MMKHDDDDHPKDAAQLTLAVRACSSKGAELADALTQMVVAAEAASRQRQRRQSGLAKLRLAVEALAGGLLLRAARNESRSAWSYQPRGHRYFTGEEVAARQYESALRVLRSMSLIEERPALTQFTNFGEDSASGRERFATRCRPTPALWTLAEQHGIRNFSDVTRAFCQTRPAKAAAPIQLRALSQREKGRRVNGAALPVPETAEARAMAAEVSQVNCFLPASASMAVTP